MYFIQASKTYYVKKYKKHFSTADLLPEHEDIRAELALARQELKDSGLRLISTSKAYFVNPTIQESAENRDDAIRNFQDTLKLG